MKRFLLIFVALALSVGLWAETQTVSYLYPVYKTAGDPTSGIASWGTQSVVATVVENTTTTLNAGWYVVTGSDVQTEMLTCNGDVNLILADGAKLTATGQYGQVGIQVSGTGKSLTIYAQSTNSAQMGMLISTGGESAAGIGGGSYSSGSNITINGGAITATGGYQAAGIGGGVQADGAYITINGGTVTATGGGGSAAGIGGGQNGSGSNIIVSTNLVVKADGNNPPTTVIPNTGSDLASSLNSKRYVTIEPAPAAGLEKVIADSVAGKAAGATVTINLDAANEYNLLGTVDAGLVNLVINGNGAKVTLADSTQIAGMQGITINNVNFDCAANTKLAPIALSANPDSVLAGKYFQTEAVNNLRAKAFYDTCAIVINGCNFSGIHTSWISANKREWNLKTLKIVNTIAQFDVATGIESYINWYGNSNNEGSIKDIVIEGSTLYNIVESNDNRFIRFQNNSNSQAQKAWAEPQFDAKESWTMTNNTFVNLPSNKEFANNYPNKNNVTFDFKGNIFYNTWRLQKIASAAIRNFIAADNSIIGVTNPVDGTDAVNYATIDSLLIQGDAPFVVPTTALDFEDIDLTDNFTPAIASYAGSHGFGDPRWLPALLDTVSYLSPVYNIAGDATSGILQWDTLQCTSYTVITDTTTTLNAGWYVVKDTVQTGTLTCNGAVNLILADGGQLTATGSNDNNTSGVKVSGANDSLTVYAQSTDAAQMGTLIANGGEGAAGIGGGREGAGSNITINGGTVTATGGDGGAGIGGGYYGSGSNITITGGTVTATGNFAAGIGGGYEGSGSNITIIDGTVIATGGSYAAGIGSGRRGQGTDITIEGGTVTATGELYGAGIGGGLYGAGSNITINGGTVTATGGLEGSGIGGGSEERGSNITISGGIVTANGGAGGAGIGGGWSVDGSNITISGGTVTANGGEGADGIGSGSEGSAASNILVSTALLTRADNNNPPTTVIPNTGTDLASSLAGKQYVTIEIAPKFTVTASVNDIAMGSVTGAGEYVIGEAVTLTATANEGYRFSNWTNANTGDTLSAENPWTITVTKDSTIVANFVINNLFTIAANVNDEAMGSVEGAGIYTRGDVAVVTAIPAEHHHFVHWNNGSIDPTTNVFVIMDTTLTATFAIDQHVVTAKSSNNALGSVAGAGTYNYGDEVTLTATPADEHSVFTGWSNGLTANPYAFTLADDTTVTAIFAADSHTIAATANDAAMGSVTGAGSYVHGTMATLVATANEHYHFVNWSNGMTVSTFSIFVDQDSAVVANFAIDQHVVRADVNNSELGTVAGAGTYDYGAQVTLTATPADAHNVFVGWSNGATANPYAFTLAGDTTIMAIFAADSHTIAATANDDAMGSVSGAGSYIHGTLATLIATANEHYHFVNWSNGVNASTFSIFVEQDSAVVANFAIDQHVVRTDVNNSALGTVAGAGTYDYDAQVTLTATPADAHSVFVGWSNGATANPYAFTLAGDTTVTAMFAADVHTIAATADPTMGSVTGAGAYTHGTMATLVATANEHYHFVNWSNGLTVNTFSILVDKDSTVVANFAIDQHVVTANVNNDALGTVAGAGTYNYGTVATLTATPAVHAVFTGWSNGATTPTINITVAGDTTVTAIFAADSHVISANADPTMGSVTGAGTYTHGTLATLVATSNEHYHFVNWSNGLTVNTFSILVDQDSTVTANFAIDQHVVTANANNYDYGTVAGAGTYNYGAQVTLTATPAYHYIFSGWSNGETANPLTFTLDGDVNVTAIFMFADPVTEYVYVTYCDNETEGTKFEGYNAGIYDVVNTYVTAIGRDSVVDSVITILPTYNLSEFETIEVGKSLEWHGRTIVEATDGDYTYVDSAKTAAGCDSVTTLYLHVTPVETGVEVISDIKMPIIVAPNPIVTGMTTYVNHDWSEEEREGMYVEIIDNFGKVIDHFTPENFPIEVRGDMASGIYHIRVVTGTQDVYVEKLIVE